MKKVILSLLAISALGLGTATAQNDSTATAASFRLSAIEGIDSIHDNTIVKSDNGLFYCAVFNHLDFGWHNVGGDNFYRGFGKSTEISFNTIALGVRPADWFKIYTGLDLKWNSFTADRNTKFTIADRKIVVNPAVDMHSTIKNFALTVPVALDFGAKHYGMRLGADVNFNLSNRTSIESAYSVGDVEFTEKQRNAMLNPTTFDFFVCAYFGGVGVYFKHCPSSLVSGNDDLIKSYSTIGLSLVL